MTAAVDLRLQIGDRSSTTSLCVLQSLHYLARACCALALHWVCIKCCFVCGTRQAATARLSCDHLVKLHLFVALLEQLSVPLQPNAWGQKPTSNPQTTLAGCEPQRAPSRAVLQANWQQDWQKSDLCSKWIRLARLRNSVADQPRSGRPHKLNASAIQHILAAAKQKQCIRDSITLTHLHDLLSAIDDRMELVVKLQGCHIGK